MCMKRARKLQALALGITYLLSLSLFNFGLASADSRPYFNGLGADTFAGGWFNSGNNSCNPSASTYQAPKYNDLPTTDHNGSIMAFAKSDGSGAGSQYGALALGVIEANSSGEPYGFVSGGSGYNKLSFANFYANSSLGDDWGGLLEGIVPQTHCIPDYYGTKKQAAPPTWTGTFSAGQYSGSGVATPFTIGAGTVPNGASITIFVDGDAYISGNITYAGGYNADNVPKFAVVAKGNIYIAPGVSQLDGLYIAQPGSDPDTSGVFWTCHDNTTSQPTDFWVTSNCNSTLLVRGAVIARQLNLTRIAGDIGNSSAAETFNFTPEMVVGGPFFNSSPPAEPKIDSLVSLPPVL